MKRNMTRKPMPYEDVCKLLLDLLQQQDIGQCDTRGTAKPIRWPIEAFWRACNANLLRKGDSR
jgi:hypothetical protein